MSQKFGGCILKTELSLFMSVEQLRLFTFKNKPYQQVVLPDERTLDWWDDEIVHEFMLQQEELVADQDSFKGRSKVHGDKPVDVGSIPEVNTDRRQLELLPDDHGGVRRESPAQLLPLQESGPGPKGLGFAQGEEAGV